MASYGVRLYEVTLRLRGGHKDKPFLVETEPDKPGFSYRDHVHTVLSSLLEIPVRGMPLSPDADLPTPEEQREQSVFVVTKVSKRGQHLVGEVRHGRPAGHDQALPAPDVANQAVLDITDHSPTRLYRFAMLTPTPGEVGILGVESISGACPARYLVQWLRKWSMDWAEANTPAQEEKRWWKIRATPLGDPATLQEFIDNSDAEKIVVLSRGSGTSRLRKDEHFRIEAPVRSSQSARVKQTLAAALTVQGLAGSEARDQQLATELAALLGDEFDDLDLDDGWVVLSNDEGGRRQVSPSRLPEVFNYPIDSRRPGQAGFLAAVREHAEALQSAINANLSWTSW